MLALYTIGHSDLSVVDFAEQLSTHSVKTLVDVRSAPYSRFVPHFNKRELEHFLIEQGFIYRYAGEYLGGRPPQADVYKDQQVPDEATKRDSFLKLVEYEEVMKRDWYLKGIERLMDLIREGETRGEQVVIMCSEGNPHECHRHHLIARSLIDVSVRVVTDEIAVYHILKGGQLEQVLPSQFVTLPKQQRLF